VECSKTSITFTRLLFLLKVMREVNVCGRKRVSLNWRDLGDISFIEGNNTIIRLVLKGNRISDLAPLQGTSVKLLEASWNPGLNPVHLLGNSTITHLYLSGIGIDNISFLKGNVTIRHLYLCSNNIIDLSPLHNNQTLRALHLDHNSISDLSPLCHNRSLRVLHLDHNSISDLSPLRESHIEELCISHNRIQCISHLPLEYIKCICLSHNNIRNVEALRGNTSIKILDLSGNHLENIDSIGSMQVETVWIAGCRLTDISGFQHTTTIRRAFLNANYIGDISPLQYNTSITELHMDNNWIEDISPLRHNHTLRCVFLGNNWVKDVSPVEHLIERLVDLSRNRIEDISSILKDPNPNMRNLGIYGNPIPKEQMHLFSMLQTLNQENYISRNISLRIMTFQFLRQ
jgi:Leucine-rich repeat (LRR) protein